MKTETLTPEEYYIQRLRQMTGLQKTERMCELIRNTYLVKASQVKKSHPNISEQELKIRVAKLIYASDAKAQELLAQYGEE